MVSYRDYYEPLAAIQHTYDPTKFFRVNSERQALSLRGNTKVLLKMLSGETDEGIFKSIE